MRGVIFAVTLVVQLVAGQLLLSDEERGEEISRAVNELSLEGSSLTRVQRLTAKNDDDHHHHHTHVTRVDVSCDDRGMRVNLEFDHPFDGVVFSKGHFGNPRCRFINKDSARSNFNFIIDPVECGTIGADRRSLANCPNCDPRESIIVIQNEEAVQEIWDSARRITCPKSQKKVVKKVSFNPFEVASFQVEEPRIEESVNVECWMNIVKGTSPFGRELSGQVRIGEELTAVVYVKDGGANYDIKVKECVAHDRADLLDRNVTSVRLSDERGCPTKKKLMGIFTRTSETGATGANIIAFAPIHAFKFADRSDVFLTCVVELCPGGCEGHCSVPTDTIEVIAVPPPTTVRTTTRFVCTPGSRDPRCTTLAPRTTTERTTTPFVCYPGSRDPRCPTPPPPTQFVCTPGSLDYRCTTPAPRTTTQRTTTPFVCYPGSRDARCPTPPPPVITTRFVCTPGIVDPRCPTPAPPTTTQRTTTAFVCTAGSTDSRCSQQRQIKPYIRNPCEVNPNGDGCSEFFGTLENHSFHAWQNRPAGAGRGRRIYNGQRPSFAAHKQKRSVNKQTGVITVTVSSNFHNEEN